MKESTRQRPFTGPPIERPSLKRVLARRLREMIFSGELPRGARIDQDGLAEHFGTSKLPIREALIMLESEALVHHVPNRGAFVASLTREDVLDHFSIYGLVASVAAERAATRLTPDQLAELEELLDQMRAEASPAAAAEINDHFHSIVNRAGSSSRLRSVLAQSIPPTLYRIIDGWRDTALDHNHEILEALKRHDGTTAAVLTTELMRNSGHGAITALEARSFWGDYPDHAP